MNKCPWLVTAKTCANVCFQSSEWSLTLSSLSGSSWSVLHADLKEAELFLPCRAASLLEADGFHHLKCWVLGLSSTCLLNWDQEQPAFSWDAVCEPQSWHYFWFCSFIIGLCLLKSLVPACGGGASCVTVCWEGSQRFNSFKFSSIILYWPSNRN